MSTERARDPVADREAQELAALTLAHYHYRRSTGSRLERLDPRRRAAVEGATAALLDGRLDVASLFAYLSENMAGDADVDRFIGWVEHLPEPT